MFISDKNGAIYSVWSVNTKDIIESNTVKCGDIICSNPSCNGCIFYPNKMIALSEFNIVDMLLYNQLRMAINIANDVHSHQVDKAGQPYILHPLWVMNKVHTLKAKIVAVLHDIVEDTNITIEDLIFKGFDEDIVEAISLLTRKKNQSYNNYIELIATNDLAKEVKIADLSHNMDLSRLKEITDKDKERYNKYLKARDYLMNIR